MSRMNLAKICQWLQKQNANRGGAGGTDGGADKCNIVDAVFVYRKIAGSLPGLRFYARNMKSHLTNIDGHGIFARTRVD